MKNLLVLILAFTVVACSQNQADYTPEASLNKDEQLALKQAIIRYVAKAPDNAIDFETRFDARYNDYYQKAIEAHTLEAYHKTADGYEYAMLSRRAPSLQEKKVAIGIKLKRNAMNEPVYYEEIYRTWKFPVAEMQQKGLMLFDLMVKGKDLSPYYPQNSGSEEYIEFPDEHTHFDMAQKRWVSDLEVVNKLENLKREILQSKNSSSRDSAL